MKMPENWRNNLLDLGFELGEMTTVSSHDYHLCDGCIPVKIPPAWSCRWERNSTHLILDSYGEKRLCYTIDTNTHLHSSDRERPKLEIYTRFQLGFSHDVIAFSDREGGAIHLRLPPDPEIAQTFSGHLLHKWRVAILHQATAIVTEFLPDFKSPDSYWKKDCSPELAQIKRRLNHYDGVIKTTVNEALQTAKKTLSGLEQAL